MTTAQTDTIQLDEIREGAIRPSPICPTPVAFSVMVHGWWNLTFLHWRVPAESVQRLLPPGLTVETFDGSAWVALVPFEMQVTLPHAPPVPWLSSFPETNVRTYVRGPDGTTGVWFFSLDAARLGAILVARIGYRLPYFWSRMTVDRIGPVVTYRTRRLGPSPRGVRSELAIEVGEPYAAHELGDLDHWLTARWRLYSATAGGLRSAQADHPPWPLHRASVRHLDDELVRAAGLEPVGDPIVHWSPGVPVRISLPHRVAYG
jgi:uncharacterized protein YqjF (DUF2071 family)